MDEHEIVDEVRRREMVKAVNAAVVVGNRIDSRLGLYDAEARDWRLIAEDSVKLAEMAYAIAAEMESGEWASSARNGSR